MIPVVAQPEPPDFDHKVRRLGRRFLLTSPKPESWNGKSYWTHALGDLREAYNGICAYCCFYIPPIIGQASVDHFIPKDHRPELAYEWSNYRFASLTLNSRKWTYLDVLDPFTIEADTFILDFSSMLIMPAPHLTDAMQTKVWATIIRLKLNEDVANFRMHWVLEYCDGHIKYSHLKAWAPFIVYEMKRQHYTKKKLKDMFKTRSVDPHVLI